MHSFRYPRQHAYLRIATLRLMVAVAALVGVVLLRAMFPAAAGNARSETAKITSSHNAANRPPSIAASPIVLISL